jgi:hypothetical protein
MQSFGEKYSAHYYLQYGVELIRSARLPVLAELNVFPLPNIAEHCWSRSLATFAPVKMRMQRPRLIVCLSTILFRDSVIMEHLGEWLYSPSKAF